MEMRIKYAQAMEHSLRMMDALNHNYEHTESVRRRRELQECILHLERIIETIGKIDYEFHLLSTPK